MRPLGGSLLQGKEGEHGRTKLFSKTVPAVAFSGKGQGEQHISGRRRGGGEWGSEKADESVS